MVFSKLCLVHFSTNEFLKFSLDSVSCNDLHFTPRTDFYSNNYVFLLINVCCAFLKVSFV